MTLLEAIDPFLLSKQSENASPCTLRAYRSDLVASAISLALSEAPNYSAVKSCEAFWPSSIAGEL